MRPSVVRLIDDDRGHAGPFPGILLAAAGAVILGIGAASDDLGWLAIAGGIALAAGIMAAFLMNHVFVEYEFYDRIDKLEKK